MAREKNIQLISADAVLTMNGPVFLDAAVAIASGFILAVGSRALLKSQHPNAPERHLQHCAILPGFVNAHVHLELSHLRGKLPPSHFVDWVIAINRLSASEAGRESQIAADAAALGAAESCGFGVTAAGDISRQFPATRAALANFPLRVVSFAEIIAFGVRRGFVAQRLAEIHNSAPCPANVTPGLAPHAPYTVEGPALKNILAVAKEHGLPVSMHLAELFEEAEFLEKGIGRIQEIYAFLSQLRGVPMLDGATPPHVGGPIFWAATYGLLSASSPVLLAHVNYASDLELQRLAKSHASVAFCPRTHAFFQHPPHRWRTMLERGINVCLATDSLASNSDLSPLREARFLLERHPDISAGLLLEMITTRAARALGLGHKIGSLAAGMAADLVALPMVGIHKKSSEQLCRDLVSEAPAPTAVWFSGREVLLRT